jgi:hypothetical protein
MKTGVATIVTLTVIGFVVAIFGPAAISAPPAATPASQPTKARANDVSETFKTALAEVSTVCLDVTQVEQRGHVFENYNAVDFAAQALAANGITVLAPGMRCEATLVIQARFAGIKRSYKEQFGKGYKICYGGAKSTGTWTLTIKDSGLAPLKLDMDATFNPATIYQCNTKESDAPLSGAWKKAVIVNLKRVGWHKMPSGWSIPK